VWKCAKRVRTWLVLVSSSTWFREAPVDSELDGNSSDEKIKA